MCELAGFMIVTSTTTKILATSNRISFSRGKTKGAEWKYRLKSTHPLDVQKMRDSADAHIHLCPVYVSHLLEAHGLSLQKTSLQDLGMLLAWKERPDLCIHLEERSSSQTTWPYLLAQAKDGHFLPNADQHILDQLSQDREGQLGFSQLGADYGQEKP